jgi:hypothetical protein
MAELAIFENMPTEYKDLLSQLEPETNLTGGDYSTNRRLSIRGGVFRQVLNGKEVSELDARSIKAIVVKSAPISRMYYATPYVEGETNPPTCWSPDTKTGRPSPDVASEGKQSETCFDCKQNIRGSGQGDSRACRFKQSIAILLADNLADKDEEDKWVIRSSDVYQLILSATSVFGDDKQKMSMQAYARHLNANRAPLASILTELRFDTDSSTPKLCFKPIRVLEQDELALAVKAQQDPDTLKLVTLTMKPKEEGLPSQLTSDKNTIAPSLFQKETTKEVEEPKVKVSKKKKVEPTPDVDLASLLDEFDD